MDLTNLTEADLPARSLADHLRDVAFQMFWEGPASPIVDLYAEAAHRAGATWAQILAVRDFCMRHMVQMDAPMDAVIEAVASVPLPV
jgi:hypothetical protein